MSPKDLYIEKLKAQLDKYSDEIARLKRKSKEAGVDASVKFENYIESLREKRDVAQKKLAEIREASDSAWEHLKDGADSAWKDVKEALRKAKSEFD